MSEMERNETTAATAPHHAHARVATASGGRYMRQLCSHFGHKVPASYDETSGRVAFDFGTCRFRVDDAGLDLDAEAATDEELARVRTVIDKHLVRFAWRETLEIAWEAPAAPAAH